MRVSRASVAGLLAVVLTSAACAGGQGEAGPTPQDRADAPPGLVEAGVERAPADSDDVAELVAGINRFGLDYYQALARGSDGDVVFSPLSIAMAFGMADVGARGATEAEIAEVFGLPVEGDAAHRAFNALDQDLADSGDSILRVANRMYPAAGFELEPDFVDTLAAQYGSELERLDYIDDTEGSRQRINEWVADRTEDLIPELLGRGFLSAETVLVLVNAIYLEAAWSQPFDSDATEDDQFTRLDGSAVNVPMMRNGELRSTFAEGDAFQAVELPYGDGELSMLVVVPDEGHFADVEGSFDATRLAEIDAAMTDGAISLTLPRWSSSLDVDLLESLPGLGLRLPFSKDADFSGMSPDPTRIDAGVHAAEVEVDEEGTVAAAATALGSTMSIPSADVSIRADRPFLYLIRDTATGAVLFQGRVLDPAG